MWSTTSSRKASWSGRPPVTAEHVAEWSSFGGPPSSKPTSPDELTFLQRRKGDIAALKRRVTEDINGKGEKKWSMRAIVMELDRQMQSDEEAEESCCEDSDRLDHRPEGGPLLQYLWSSPPLRGQTLYLGGEVGSDGNIYLIPGHAGRVLQINTQTDTVMPIGPELFSNGRLYKWLRGIVVGDIIYGLPCHADEILKINVVTHQITKLPIPYEQFYPTPEQAQQERQRIWKYHGGAICPLDDCIYAIPQSALHVLKIDPATETVSFVGPAFSGTCKWYGGILGQSDGAIYGIPQNAAGVLRIAPNDVTEWGDFGLGNHKWHGGAAAANGVIVSVPANADTVLCVIPGQTPQLQSIGLVRSGRHRTDGKYKFLGAMASSVNGKVYVFPSASEYVLQVDTVHMVAKNVGPNLRDAGLEAVYQDKWQNGLACPQDGCVYGVSLSAHTLLRIDCNDTTSTEQLPDPIVTTWKLPSPRMECHHKFEGGVITASGVMYTVPNNHKGVLKIEPPPRPSSKD